MTEYKIEDIFEEVVLNIEDFKFALKERTASLAARVEPLEERLTKLDDDEGASQTAAAELLIELIDAVLEPQGNGDGTRKHAKTVLGPAYKNEKIGLDRLIVIADFLREKMNDRRRPTSPQEIAS